MRDNNTGNNTKQTIILKLIPITCVVIFAAVFKALSKYSYCNLEGELCEKPNIAVNNETGEITTSCQVKTDNTQEKKKENKAAADGTFAGFSILLIVLLVVFGVLKYKNIITWLTTLTLTAFFSGSIISILVDNREEIKKGNIDYALSRGVVNVIWAMHIIHLILLVAYVIYIISKGQIRRFIGVDFSIIILIIIILIQTIIYGVFQQDCSVKYDYQCQSTLDQIIEKLPENKTLVSIENGVKSTTSQNNNNELKENKYKVSCVATGIHKMNVETGQIIIAICAVIIVLVNYKDIFKTGKHLLSYTRIKNEFVMGVVSIFYLAIIIILLVLSFA